MAIRKELIDLKKDIYNRYNMPYDSNKEECAPKFVFEFESIIDRTNREYMELMRSMGWQDQEVPGDASKCFCYQCKNVFPRKEMVTVQKDGNIESKDRTIINGIITVDYNHYHRINVLLCKKCAKRVKFSTYLFLFGKYGFIIPVVLSWIIFVCEFNSVCNFNSGIMTFIMALGVVWTLVSCILFNKRRFYIE
ncbi:MAG: hypothetical protein IJR87_08950 [Bacteroidaceae bacterium]|nr:hypothetical protein [Bacteroidaceae bacterium]